MLQKALVDGIIGQLQSGIAKLQEIVDQQPAPAVLTLNRRSTIKAYGVAAVDAGQQMLGGILQDLGIAILRVAASEDNMPEREYILWTAPSLPVKGGIREKVIREQLEQIGDDPNIKPFLAAIGWSSIYDNMPPKGKDSAPELVNFVRDILEWGTIYTIAKDLKQTASKFPNLRPVMLRDGILRLGHMGEGTSKALRQAFSDLNVPVIGVAKSSELLTSKFVRLWLLKHSIIQHSGAFVVEIPDDIVTIVYCLKRYNRGAAEDSEEFYLVQAAHDRLQSGIHFGKFFIARFDQLSGSDEMFVLDVQPHVADDKEALAILLSGVGQCATTAYPSPGYLWPLRRAHERANIRKTTAELLESAVAQKLPTGLYNLIKKLLSQK